MIDTGADISVFKFGEFVSNQIVDSQNKCTISEIPGNKLETVGSTLTSLNNIDYEF